MTNDQQPTDAVGDELSVALPSARPSRPSAAKLNQSARGRSRFFLIASAIMTAIVFLGFMPSFFLRPYFRDNALPLHLIVHGAIMTAWQLLFLTQTILVARRRTDLHRRLGVAGAGLAFLVIVTGVHTTLLQPSRLTEAGIRLPFPLELLVVGNLFGFALFAGFVATAILLRRDAQAHKRLIFWACIVTMGPALTPARSLGEFILPFFPATFPPEVTLGWVAWIALLAHDWLSARRFHPVTIVGGMLILFVQMAIVDWLLMIDAVGAWARSLG